jgi:hypothetical protein
VLVARRREELGRVQLDARSLMAEMNTDDQHRSDRIVEVIVGRQAIATRFDQLLQGAKRELLVRWTVRPTSRMRAARTTPCGRCCVDG